jgi:hypothetical protein
MPRRLIQNAAFGPEVIHILGLAFDEACARAGANQGQHELYAKRIIEAATAGERDVGRLADFAMNGNISRLRTAP